MNDQRLRDQQPERVRMAADVEAPDKVIYGLTFRQLAIIATAGVVLAGGWHALHRLMPTPLLLAVAIIIGGLAFGIAVGRRDGLPLDIWLLAAIRYRHAPRALSTIDTQAITPAWVTPLATRMPLPAPLNLPAAEVADDGEIRLGDSTTAAVVAATTVNLTLRTGTEQDALIDTFGRWLNSLSDPTQIVVSAQPVDLDRHAAGLAEQAAALPDAALASACADHARFLSELADRRDPLHRQVLITGRSSAGAGHAARRRADESARALSGLGIAATTLDGPAATAALASCADPYRPPRPGGLAPPDTVITAAPPGSRKRRP